MTEVIMLTILMNAEVIGRRVPLQTCVAVQEAVRLAEHSRDLIWNWPDRPLPRERIVYVACMPDDEPNS